MSRDDEQVWAELVETFHTPSDRDARQWPAAEDVDADGGDPPQADADDEPDDSLRDRPEPQPGPDTLHPAPTVEQRLARDPEEHFVPPPPPPLPSTDLITRLAWVGVLGTPFVFLVIVLLGRSVPGLMAAIGAGAFIGGFVILVSRLRGHDPYDPDDGAVV